MGKYRIILLLITLVYGLVAVLQAQTRVFPESKGSPATGKYYDFEKWSFSIGKDKYEITNKGRGKRISGKKRVTKFRISLAGAEILNRTIYFAEYKNDLLLISELGFGDGGTSFIVCLNGKSLKTKWRAAIDGFNVGQGLIENKFAYLTAIGFIGKIDLNTGKYVWKHEDLYRKYDESGAFNSFLTPEIKADIVIFKEEGILNKGFDHQIQVNKSSGKIIKVLLN